MRAVRTPVCWSLRVTLGPCAIMGKRDIEVELLCLPQTIFTVVLEDKQNVSFCKGFMPRCIALTIEGWFLLSSSSASQAVSSTIASSTPA